MSRISLSGDKGSGKSTAAEHLQKLGFEEYAFADPLKRLIIDIFQIDPIYVYDPLYKETVIEELGVSARQLMQIIGTELFRNALVKHLPQLKLRGPTVWIHNLLKRIEKSSGNIVVSDTRMSDEYYALANAGFTTYRIVRDVQTTETSNHESEHGCPCDDTILNNGTVADLHAKVESVIQ